MPIRLLSPDDAPTLAEQMRVNRDFLAPFEPARDASYSTEAGQRAVIHTALRQHREGITAPYVIEDDAGQLIGRITLSDIVRGPLQSCSLGYFVAEAANGRGAASAAVRDIVHIAFADLGLHRVQAGTLLDNVRSQRVLERNGFIRFGVAPQLLRIAGRWQDHALYQVLAPSQP